jgi:hypothetical protein
MCSLVLTHAKVVTNPEDSEGGSLVFFRPVQDLEGWDEDNEPQKNKKRDFKTADPEKTRLLELDDLISTAEPNEIFDVLPRRIGGGSAKPSTLHLSFLFG